ncbi:MAG: type-F conjugative transfer system protein TraW [Azonexus sp.]|nr:type-F conjugative transfer system protein TraW [Azonexus sp.]
MTHKSTLIGALLFASVIAGPAWSLDLGVHGPLYPIDEPDFLVSIEEQMRAKVESGEWDSIVEEAKARVTENAKEPRPVDGLELTSENRSRMFDPSITLTEAITDHESRVLFPAGTRVNPLESVSLREALLLFDGRDKAQVALAERLMAESEVPIKPILVGGSWAKLSDAWERQVYFDQYGVICERFGITRVPALITQVGVHLRIDEIVPEQVQGSAQ